MTVTEGIGFFSMIERTQLRFVMSVSFAFP